MAAHTTIGSLVSWRRFRKPASALASLLALGLILSGCLSAAAPVKNSEDSVRETLADTKPPAPVRSTIQTPDFIPVTEDISPLNTRIVDIMLRNTPLGDVLHVIAEATGLNLVIEKGVSIDQPITVTLRNVTAGDALNTVFSSTDYFYSIKDNVLVVKALGTKVLELGHPALILGYGIDIGGDILGSATSSSSTGGSSSASSASSIKGTVTQTGKNDPTAFNFWESLEKSIVHIVCKADQAEGAGAEGQSVTVNRLTGTIVVTATKNSLERVEQYLDAVRRALNRQVLVEARIIEVQLSDRLKYGIDWSFLSGDVTAGFGNLNIATRGFNDGIESAMPAFRVGIDNRSFQSILDALRRQGNVRTLSNPRVNVMNGQTALLSVGRNFNYVSNVSTTTTSGSDSVPMTTYTVETSSVLSGLLIGIVPFINENREISLTVTPIISDLVSLEDKKIGQSGDNQVLITLPTMDLREMSTTVKVRDGQTVVIGGLISTKNDIAEDKIPLLGDIPWLGMLFTKRTTEETRSELVVVLQPVLVSSGEF